MKKQRRKEIINKMREDTRESIKLDWLSVVISEGLELKVIDIIYIYYLWHSYKTNRSLKNFKIHNLKEFERKFQKSK